MLMLNRWKYRRLIFKIFNILWCFHLLFLSFLFYFIFFIFYIYYVHISVNLIYLAKSIWIWISLLMKIRFTYIERYTAVFLPLFQLQVIKRSETENKTEKNWIALYCSSHNMWNVNIIHSNNKSETLAHTMIQI